MEKIVIITTLIVMIVAPAAPHHPNVLLLMVDDLRPALGCYGDTTAITPSIDALATMGVTFTKAFAQQALCGPSRTSLLTSRRPSSTGVVDVHRYWRHRANYTSLPQHFREHGYYTASAGKIFHPGICSNFTDDALYSWSGTPYHPSTEAYKNSPVCAPHKNATDIVCPVTVKVQPEQTLPDMQTTHHAISFLHRWKQLQKNGGPVRRGAEGACKDRDCHQPFFLAVGFHKPHIPLKYPKQFLDLYPLSRVPLPPHRRLPPRLPPVAFNPWNDLRGRHDVASLNLTFPYQPMPDHYARRIIQSYYAATSYTDLLIGDLLTVTESLFPDTVVALLGDHGWSLGEHQEWSKFSNYEVATRVPLIVAGIRGYKKTRQTVLMGGKRRKYDSKTRKRKTGRENRKTGRGNRKTGRGNRKTGRENRKTGRGNRKTGRENRKTGRGNRKTGRGTRKTGRGNRMSRRRNRMSRRGNRNVILNNNNTGNENRSSRRKHHNTFRVPSERGDGTHASSNVKAQRRNRSRARLFNSVRNNDSRKEEATTRQDINNTSNNDNTRHSDINTGNKFRRRKSFAQHKRKQMKLYMKIRRRLGRYFHKWQGVDNKQKLDYEQHWRFSEWFSNTEAVADEVQDRVRERKFTGNETSSFQKNEFQRLSGGYIPMRRNVTYDGIVELVDLFPTLADLAGIQKVPECESRTVNDRNHILSHDGQKRTEVKLCTEGHSLSSIIIDNGNANIVPPLDHSPGLTFPRPLNQWPRETPDHYSQSPSKIELEAIGVSRISPKQNEALDHLNTSSSSSPRELSYPSCSFFVGRVGISQYPRPTLTPSQHPDSDQPHLTETIVMGYSIRSLCYRYTLWVAFNSTTFLPNFNVVYGEELYDHRTDPGENKNLLWSRRKMALLAQKRLRLELARTLY